MDPVRRGVHGPGVSVFGSPAQIYAIDSLAAGAPIDHVRLANLLQVTEENFEAIRNCIEKNKDHKLRSIRDELVVFSYNQIRFVLACMIIASPQTSFGVRLSRIHFSPTDVC